MQLAILLYKFNLLMPRPMTTIVESVEGHEMDPGN